MQVMVWEVVGSRRAAGVCQSEVNTEGDCPHRMRKSLLHSDLFGLAYMTLCPIILIITLIVSLVAPSAGCVRNVSFSIRGAVSLHESL
jgi:hypothetical protein